MLMSLTYLFNIILQIKIDNIKKKVLYKKYYGKGLN